MTEGPARTSFAEAIRLAIDEEERARLSQLKLDLDLASGSPEWAFYAVVVPPLTRVARRAYKLLDAIQFELVKAVKNQHVAPTHGPPSPIIIRPTFSAAIYVVVAVLLAAIAAYVSFAVTSTTADARFVAAQPQIAKLITTPGGKAALTLLSANGDGLAAELKRCIQRDERGRTAITCTFWADGTAYALPQTPGDALVQILAVALPYAGVAIVAGAFTLGLSRKMPKNGA